MVLELLRNNLLVSFLNFRNSLCTSQLLIIINDIRQGINIFSIIVTNQKTDNPKQVKKKIPAKAKSGLIFPVTIEI